jgi:hypothetical protein
MFFDRNRLSKYHSGQEDLPMRRRFGKLIGILILAPVFFFLMLNAHELGHTLLARLAGDENATYYLYKQFDLDKACVGCNVYDPRKLSDLGNLVVTLGGVLATALVLLIQVWVWRRPGRARVYPYLVITAIITVASDVPFQVFRGMQADVAGQSGLTGVDLADFLYILHSRFAVPIEMAKFGLLLFAATYCFVCYRMVCSRPGCARPGAGAHEVVRQGD